jgi:hypothetical protein
VLCKFWLRISVALFLLFFLSLSLSLSLSFLHFFYSLPSSFLLGLFSLIVALKMAAIKVPLVVPELIDAPRIFQINNRATDPAIIRAEFVLG